MITSFSTMCSQNMTFFLINIHFVIVIAEKREEMRNSAFHIKIKKIFFSFPFFMWKEKIFFFNFSFRIRKRIFFFQFFISHIERKEIVFLFLFSTITSHQGDRWEVKREVKFHFPSLFTWGKKRGFFQFFFSHKKKDFSSIKKKKWHIFCEKREVVFFNFSFHMRKREELFFQLPWEGKRFSSHFPSQRLLCSSFREFCKKLMFLKKIWKPTVRIYDVHWKSWTKWQCHQDNQERTYSNINVEVYSS